MSGALWDAFITLKVALGKRIECQEISFTACSSCSSGTLYEHQVTISSWHLTDQLYLTSYQLELLHASSYLFGILKILSAALQPEDLRLFCRFFSSRTANLFRSTVVTVCRTVANYLLLFARLASHLNHLDSDEPSASFRDYLNFQS